MQGRRPETGAAAAMTNAGIVRRFLTEGYENKNYTAVMLSLIHI